MSHAGALSFRLLTTAEVDDTAAPSLQDIYRALDWAQSTGAGATLESYRDAGPADHLTLASEHGLLLVTMFRPDVPDPVDEVVPLDNPEWETENMPGLFYKDDSRLGRVPMVELDGYYWDARTVTTNLGVVKAIFAEFYETGRVTHPWFPVDYETD